MTTPRPGLGRIQVTDTRDHAFLMSPPPRSLRISRSWDPGDGKTFDQGQKPQCVAYTAMRLLVSAPVRNKVYEAFDAFYAQCQAIDGIRGPHDGSTVRAAMKVLKAAGFLDSYQWAFDVQTVINQVLEVGPVDVGTDWTNDMFEPDAHHFIHVGAAYDVAGGHSYLLSGVDTSKRCPDGTVGAFKMTNPWGLGWGVKGQAWLSIRDFGILLNHKGEAARVVEAKKKSLAA